MSDLFLVSSSTMQKVAQLPRSMILVYLRMCWKMGCKEVAGHEIVAEYNIIEFVAKDMRGHGVEYDGNFFLAIKALTKIGVIKRVNHRPAKYRVF